MSVDKLMMLLMLQSRLGIPTGRADIGLEPRDDTVAFLRRLQRDFVKVQQLLKLIVDREQLKREQVCEFVSLAACIVM